MSEQTHILKIIRSSITHKRRNNWPEYANPRFTHKQIENVTLRKDKHTNKLVIQFNENILWHFHGLKNSPPVKTGGIIVPTVDLKIPELQELITFMEDNSWPKENVKKQKQPELGSVNLQ